ncbi:sugar ABC transporter ATP-binding protein [candidate division KSB3 bacterium]|uniref:Sugar ABC transporter ATP-binding protein n=1 Tax=candidate division KSB3 bacterium TaxID=2044937 RepID=A0A2G6KIZ5_9BACT|nr:MAG: sugar ABC transporter ATP-binding protein [candidate division KSB3 bacterium]
MAVVALRNVVKHYDGEPALQGIDFETRDGEFFILLGPSGAGKTTTLKVIAGLEDIDSGDVLFDGTVVSSVPTNLRHVGMAFESYALYPLFTVFENIANPLRAPGKNLSESEINDRVTKMAKLLRIDHLLDRRPGELSGGQKQRVSLGRTMVGEPSVYLLDEPLTHVDAKIRFDLRIQFHRLEELQKSTTIYVTHDYVEALSLGDRIGIINEGRILQVGTPKQIYYTPKNMFIAHLVGQPPINFLDATIETDGQVSWLHIPKGHFTFPLTQERMKALEQAGAPRQLIVGVRPADIHITKTTEDAPVSAKCDVFEPLGSVGLLSVMINNDLNLEMLVDPESSLDPDMEFGITFRDDRLLFFDPATENNLLWSE